MTVKEFIEKLKEFPEDFEVFSMHSRVPGTTSNDLSIREFALWDGKPFGVMIIAGK